jgi:tetratricopeptide (TPR) repeat protein
MNMSIARLIAASLLAFGALDATAGSYCGSLKNAFGPFDYRKSKSDFPNETYLVEMAHFTPDVENLVKGNAGYLGGDLDYTLRAFPNHPRALTSVAKLALKEKTPKDPNMHYSFTCYFERAMRFMPDDDGVYTIYGTYLYKKGDIGGATTQLKHALTLNPNNPAANYNLGLIYINQNKPDEARVYAKKAEALDYPVHALKDRLIQAGKWDAR